MDLSASDVVDDSIASTFATNQKMAAKGFTGQVKLPITMDFDGTTKDCTIEAPVIPDSHVPMLYGLNSMERNRTVLDLTNGVVVAINSSVVT